MSIFLPILSFFKFVSATAICPFNILVKISFIFFLGLEKQIVLVTSVVPYLYWPPESHKNISFFLINFVFFFSSSIVDYCSITACSRNCIEARK